MSQDEEQPALAETEDHRAAVRGAGLDSQTEAGAETPGLVHHPLLHQTDRRGSGTGTGHWLPTVQASLLLSLFRPGSACGSHIYMQLRTSEVNMLMTLCFRGDGNNATNRKYDIS